MPPSSRHTLGETIFFLLSLGFFWCLQKMTSCVFSFPAAGHRRERLRTKTHVYHHFVNNSSGFNNKWTSVPRAIPPPKIDEIASKLATHIGGNNFCLTPAGGFVGFTENNKLCFLFFLLFPLPATAENDSNKTPRLSPFC